MNVLTNIKRLLKFIFVLFIFFLALYFTNGLIQQKIFNKSYSNFFGYSHVVAVGNSMNKSIQNGDLLIIKKCSNYKVGDVICFVENGQVISHRIVEFNQDKIITKGDNNASFDQPISKNQICGKVVLISGVLGKVFCFFPIILLGIFIVSILMKIVKF